MAICNDASLRGKHLTVSEERELRPQEVLQMFHLNICWVREKRRMLISSFSKVACFR